MFGSLYKTFIDDLVGKKNNSIMPDEGLDANIAESLVYESRDITKLSENGNNNNVAMYTTSSPTNQSALGSFGGNSSFPPLDYGNGSFYGRYESCHPEIPMMCLDPNMSVPFHLERNEMTSLTVPVFGYASPTLVAFTIITNTLVCVVLMKKHMRTPTNLLLFAMALSDMFTGVFPVPCFIYFYTFEEYKEWVPFEWCFLYGVLVDTIPTIFHTASIYLTVALAGQRYIYVCHSMKARQICTLKNSVKTIGVIYIVSILLHICRFFENTYTPRNLPSFIHNDKNVTGCTQEFIPFVAQHSNVYFNMYYWMRVLFIHAIPCVTLVLLNLLLIIAMKSAQARRKQLLKQNRRTECRKLKENNCTTLMLVAVVGLFLLVEIPLAVLLIIMVLENTFEMNIPNMEDRALAGLLINFFILLSYPVNFFIYCGMSRQFRETFKRLFVPGAAPIDRDPSQYMSLATENGGKTVQTNESAL